MTQLTLQELHEQRAKAAAQIKQWEDLQEKARKGIVEERSKIADLDRQILFQSGFPTEVLAKFLVEYMRTRHLVSVALAQKALATRTGQAHIPVEVIRDCVTYLAYTLTPISLEKGILAKTTQ